MTATRAETARLIGVTPTAVRKIELRIARKICGACVRVGLPDARTAAFTLRAILREMATDVPSPKQQQNNSNHQPPKHHA